MRKFFQWLLVLLFSATMVGGLFYFDDSFYRIEILGGLTLFFILLVNMYTVRKRFILRRAEKWKLTEEQREELPRAHDEIDAINRKIRQGQLQEPSEIKDMAENVIANLTISRLFSIDVKKIYDGSLRAVLTRREPWGRLSSWYNFHLYVGFLAFVGCLAHAQFLPGKIFITQALFWLMVIVAISGIMGAVINKYLPPMMTKMEQDVTLEQLVYLRERLIDQKEEILENRTKEFQSLIKKARRKKKDGVEKFLDSLPEEDHHPFLQAFTLSLEIDKVKKKIRRRKVLYFFLRRWFLLHIPPAITLIILSLIHAAVALYY